MKKTTFSLTLAICLASCLICNSAFGQKPLDRQHVRTMVVPISIFTKQELKENQLDEYVQAERLVVKEDNEEQEILSIRSVGVSPLSIAILIQEDLSSTFNLQLKDIEGFIRSQPRGTRVMVGYLRAGSMQIRQKFTDDLEKAAKSLRVVASNASSAPRSPYDGVDEALGKFDALPNGRRAILLFSDGLDSTQGLSPESIIQSLDLDRATLKAQRKGVAIYSFYFPATYTQTDSSSAILGAQSALEKLSEESGGRAFFQGSIAPLSFEPYFKQLIIALNRQFALTYLSTHMQKGYHKLNVQSTNPNVKIIHPKGYYYR